MTGKTLNTFKDTYQNSEEERSDVLAAYTSAQGDMNRIFKQVMLSNPLDDEERFRRYINEAIEVGNVASFEAYARETVKKKENRHKAAEREGVEAKEHAKKIGVYDQLFGDANCGGGKKGKKGDKGGGSDGLAALIHQRQKARAGNFMDAFEAKFAGGGKNGKKRKNEEPPEELFHKNRQQKKGSISKVNDVEDEEGDLDVETEPEDGFREEDEEEQEVVKPITSKSRSKGTRASARKGKKKDSA